MYPLTSKDNRDLVTVDAISTLVVATDTLDTVERDSSGDSDLET